MVEDFKLVFRIRYFNYFFFFCVEGEGGEGGVRRSDYLGCPLWWQGYLWYALKYGLCGERAFRYGFCGECAF